jgi:diguanylate cyclase (GGDEF)-like protein
LRDHSYGDFHSEEETRLFIEKVLLVFRKGESASYEYRSSRDFRCFLQTISPVKDKKGKTAAVVVISKDITHLKVMEEKLIALSFTDDLTGLYNRRGFFTLVEQQLKMSVREKKGRCLLSADLDDLKTINDTMGHKEGDFFLLQTAILLKESFRDSDIIARIGGDEFVVFVLEAGKTGVKALTERLERNSNEFNERSGKPRRLSLSYGIAFFDPGRPVPISELVAQADKMLYEQKKLK